MSSNTVFINEVAPRDGFQMEPGFIPTADKIAFIDALGRMGFAKIEATSFTSPKAIPALADAADVMAGIKRHPGVVYTVLVPNLKGAERAIASGADELNFVLSVSESHSKANLRMTGQQSLDQLKHILELSTQRVPVAVSLSTTFGCPFEGTVAPQAVFNVVQQLVDLGIEQIALCDTTGMANPLQVQNLCWQVLERWPQVRWTVHFHDTRGMGLANAYSAFNAGIRYFDAALGGLGGCPFAPGATGNVCTEDLVHMFNAMGVSTGVDLDALLAVAAGLPDLVGHPVFGQVAKAGPYTRRYPMPV